MGNVDWLLQNYKFSEICESLDELHIIDVNPSNNSQNVLSEAINKILNNVFIPVGVGGGIRNEDDAKKILNLGADKIIINSLLDSPKHVEKISSLMGSQSITGLINYRLIDKEIFAYDWKTASIITNKTLNECINTSIKSGVGEIILNSVDRDGTGFGFDIQTIKKLEENINVPIIASGGAGKSDHFWEAFRGTSINGASTANLLNFMGNALPDIREDLLEKRILLANF